MNLKRFYLLQTFHTDKAYRQSISRTRKNSVSRTGTITSLDTEFLRGNKTEKNQTD